MNVNKKYVPLWTSKYRYAILSGGRGSGKSVASQAFLRDLSYQAGHKIISTRYTMVSAERSVIPEFAGKLDWDKSPYGDYKMSEDFALTGRTFTNLVSKSEVSFMGLKTSSGMQTASLKSIEGVTTWSLDESEELVEDGTDTKSNTFDSLDNSIRIVGMDLRTILSWNPSNEDSFMFQRFFKEPNIDITFNGVVDDVLYIYTTYEDNLDNLHPSFIKKAERLKTVNPPRYNHIYKGLPIKENDLALWKSSTMIAPYRVREAPLLKRIVVGVDPSVSDTGKQDECGIIVAGIAHDNQIYILRDASAVLSPSKWAETAVGVYKEYEADRITAEVNNGGQLIEDIMKNVDDSIPVTQVRASRGKITRAEPVSALYEQGRVHHVGVFKELEFEMSNYTGEKGQVSPNRLDALVWALFDLAIEKKVEASVDFF